MSTDDASRKHPAPFTPSGAAARGVGGSVDFSRNFASDAHLSPGRWRFALLVLLCWTVPGLMTTTVGLTLNRNPSEPELSLVPIFISQLLVWWYWAALTPAVWWLGRTFPVERQRLAFSLPIHAACAMAAGLFYAISSALIMRLSFPETAGTEPLLQWIRNYLTTRLPVGVLLYFALLGIGAALDSRLRLRQRDLHAARLSEQLAQAQVQALQTQLQPHFLFNTLHAIGMLVHEDPPAAGRMLTRLGDLLRQTLALTDVPEIPLRQELSILDDYLGIERVRFGDRLSVELEIDQSLLSAAVPTFVMQPLVENAVRFGVTSRVGPGRVRIIAKPVGSGMQLVVQDDGPETNGEQKSAELLGHMPGATSLDEATPGMMPIGVSASTHSEARNGIGLSSIKARLAALYPHEEQASLALIKLPNGGTSAVLSLPRRDIHA